MDDSLKYARHEAAHAVIGQMCGTRPIRLELLEKPDNKGGVAYCHNDGRCKVGPLAFSITSIAGPVADWVLSGGHKDTYSSGDVKDIQRTGLTKKELWLLRNLCLPLVLEKSAQIERIARRLVKRRVLKGAELRRLLKGK